MYKIETLSLSNVPADELVALYKDAGWWDEPSVDPAQLVAMVRGSLFFLVVREEDSGHIVGMGRVISDGVSDGYIQDVVVLSSHRGKGLGKKLVSGLLALCQEIKLPWVGLVAEPGTEPFYASLGLRPRPGFQLMTLQ